MHSHSHEHHHTPASINAIFIFCIAINMLFVVVEVIVGFSYNSLGLISDAGHNLSDVLSLFISLIAILLAKKQSTKHFTYGYKKSTVLASLVNAVILFIAAAVIIIESIQKLKNPSPVSGTVISWTAGIGIIINGFTAFLLMKNSKHDINIRGVFLHFVMDTLVSVGVVASGILIMLTGLMIIDPIIGMIIAVIIIVSSWNIMKESVSLAIDAVPSSLHVEDVEKCVSSVPGVLAYHHLHIWAISTTETAATLHVVVDDLSNMEAIKQAIRESLSTQNINHCTIECEGEGQQCSDFDCRDTFNIARKGI